ncbi:hypothetical protein GCM10011391_27970 [Pullulanibacillus camelliae]|uniref:Siphovirus-type tail component RIFT-related domain-containing protein n=2 Tax=Pullulanibacillus camelliae TaxID=1707096 RepID=A0A8J2YJP4_9BACL|nr:hypothetical protein GCM10011391_27970 [Pullulanibacillus camelliae]
MLTFNNYDFKSIFGQKFRVSEITGRGPFGEENKNQIVPGIPGSYPMGSRRKERMIGVKFSLIADSKEDLRELVDRFNSLIYSDDEVPFGFDDEAATYFGKIDGDPDWSETKTGMAKGLITFKCSDPNKYGPELTQTINDPDGDADEIVTNEGSAETYPTFTATILKPTTFLQIVSPEAYMQVGQAVDVEGSTVQEYELLIDDDMSSLNGWGQSDFVTDGYALGTIETDGTRFYPTSFGAAQTPERWQGPALKKSLPEEVQDFEMNAAVRAENVGYETGMVEIYLLDAQNNQVARIHMADSWTAYAKNEGRVQLGSGDAARFPYVTNPPGQKTDWNNFYGILKLQRRGNRWWFYFARVDGDTRIQISDKHYIPPDGLYMDKVAQVQIAFRKWPNTNHSRMGVYALKFWKLNDVGEQQVPYIADVGDKIIFDHKRALITNNGDETFIQYKDFGASYFPIGKGSTQLAVNPPDAAKVDVNWRSAYK